MTVQPPIFDLDAEKVGQIILRLPASAALAGHTTVRSTVRDYFRAELMDSDRELAFVRDLLILPVREIADRWYGGELEAAAMASGALADRYG